jgi:predicted O-linked N-acetylglucosamine transferase (SPINDLY family)
MGVPVVTLMGRTHVSRVGVSLLTNASLPELVARSPDEYLSIANNLACNPSRLQELRANLRHRLKASPLLDAKRFTRDIEAAYRRMWHIWCESASARS